MVELSSELQRFSQATSPANSVNPETHGRLLGALGNEPQQLATAVPIAPAYLAWTEQSAINKPP